MPVTLTTEGIADFDNVASGVKRQIDKIAEEYAKADAKGSSSARQNAVIGAQKDLSNIGERAAEAFNSGNLEGFVQILGDAQLALGDAGNSMNYLSDEMLKASGVQGLWISGTTDYVKVLEELSKEGSSVHSDTQERIAGWLAETEGMSEAARVAKINELAAADAAEALGGIAEAAADVGENMDPATPEEFAAALDGMAAALAMSNLEFDANAAAADAFALAMDRATSVSARLSAGLSGGKAFKSLREGMTGEKAIAGIMDKAAKSTKSASSSVDRLSDAARRADPKMSALQVRMDALSAAGDAFTKSIDNSSMLDDQVSSALNLGDAYQSFEKTYRRLPATLDMTAMATGKLRPRQVDAIQNMLGLGKAARDYLATLIEMGESEGHVAGEAAKMREEYAAKFRAMGMGEDQILKYIEAMGLLPKQVTTAIRVSGAEMAKTQLNAYLSLLEGRIPPEVATSVVAKLDSGDVEGAAKTLANLARSNPALIEVGVDTKALDDVQDQIADVKKGLWELPQEFDPLKAMLGEYTDAQTAALDAVLAFGDGVQEYLSRVAHDGNADVIRDQAHQIRDAFLEQLESFGIVGDAAQEYLELIGLSDWQIDSAINLSGDAEAMMRIQMYSQFLADEIDPEVLTEVMAHIDEGELQAAADRLSEWRVDEENKPITLRVQAAMGQVPFFNVNGPAGRALTKGLQAHEARRVPARAAGGPVWPGTFLVGEEGPELVEFSGSGQVFNAADTRRYLSAGGPGSNLMAVPSSVSLDARSLAALEAARGGDHVEFSGGINIRSTDPKQSLTELVGKVGSKRFLGGRR